MIRKEYSINNKDRLYRKLIDLLNPDDLLDPDYYVTEYVLDQGRVYHIGNTTFCFETYCDEYIKIDTMHGFDVVIGAANEEILNRDFQTFLSYIKKVDPDYDISANIKENIPEKSE